MDEDTEGEDAAGPQPLLEHCGIVLDAAAGRVTIRGRPVRLTNRELEVLRLLLKARGKPVSAADIQRQIWPGRGSGSPSQVAMIIGRLRRRLGNPRAIETIGGEGYRLASSEERMRP